MRRLWIALAAASLAMPAAAALAQDWGNFAMISSTLGVKANRLCIGEGLRVADIGCPSYAPSVTTAGDVSVTGNLSANKFIGDGSGLTGLTADTTDRIVSGTTRMVVVSETGYVSLTQTGTNTGWFDPTRGLVTLGVSATGGMSATTGYFAGKVGIGWVSPNAELDVSGTVSATTLNSQYLFSTQGHIGALTGGTAAVGGLTVTGNSRQKNVSITNLIQMPTTAQACIAGISGSIRYSAVSSTVEYCNSTAWVSMGPSETAPVAFSIYMSGNQTVGAGGAAHKLTLNTETFDTNNNFDNASNYRFTPTVRGKYFVTLNLICTATNGYCTASIYKNGTSIARQLGTRETTASANGAAVSILVDMNGSTDYLEAWGSNGGGTVFSGGQNETRFSGFLVGPQAGGSGGGGANSLDELTDVDTSGASTGSVLSYNGSSWVISSTGATSAASSTGAIQFNAGGGALGGDTSNLYWEWPCENAADGWAGHQSTYCASTLRSDRCDERRHPKYRDHSL